MQPKEITFDEDAAWNEPVLHGELITAGLKKDAVTRYFQIYRGLVLVWKDKNAYQGSWPVIFRALNKCSLEFIDLLKVHVKVNQVSPEVVDARNFVDLMIHTPLSFRVDNAFEGLGQRALQVETARSSMSALSSGKTNIDSQTEANIYISRLEKQGILLYAQLDDRFVSGPRVSYEFNKSVRKYITKIQDFKYDVDKDKYIRERRAAMENGTLTEEMGGQYMESIEMAFPEPCLLSVMNNYLCRTLNLGQYPADLKILRIYMQAYVRSQVIPKFLKLLTGLQLPIAGVLSNPAMYEAKYILPSNKITLFHSNEFLLFFIDTAPLDTLKFQVSWENCVMFTTHRFISLRKGKMLSEVRYVQVNNVAVCGEVGAQYELDVMKGVSNVAMNVDVEKPKTIFKSIKNTFSRVLGGASSDKRHPSNNAPKPSGSIEMVDVNEYAKRTGKSSLGHKTQFLPSTLEIGGKARLVVQLLNGRYLPVYLPKEEEIFVCCVNLLARIVTLRKKQSVMIESNAQRLLMQNLHLTQTLQNYSIKHNLQNSRGNKFVCVLRAPISKLHKNAPCSPIITAPFDTNYDFLRSTMNRMLVNIALTELGVDKKVFSKNQNYAVLKTLTPQILVLDQKPMGHVWKPHDKYYNTYAEEANEEISHTVGDLTDISSDDDDSDNEDIVIPHNATPIKSINTTEEARQLVKPIPPASASNLYQNLCFNPHLLDKLAAELDFEKSNGLPGKYKGSNNFDICVASFTGSNMQQWAWGDDDSLQLQHIGVKTSAGTQKLDGEVGDEVVEVLWQNQRFLQSMWSNALYSTDLPNWCTEEGRFAPPALLERAIGPTWRWEGKWTVDQTLGDTDGWVYSAQNELGVGSGLVKYDKRVHCLRKRRWLRTRVCMAVSQKEKKLPEVTVRNIYAGDISSPKYKLAAVHARLLQEAKAEKKSQSKSSAQKLSSSYFTLSAGKVRSIVLQPSSYMEYVYEVQTHSLFSGWVSTRKSIEMVPSWGSHDAQIDYSSPTIEAGVGFEWCSDWFIDTRLACDQEGWVYRRRLASDKTYPKKSLTTPFRARRWARCKRDIHPAGRFPPILSNMEQEYAQDDSIQCTDQATKQTFVLTVESETIGEGSLLSLQPQVENPTKFLMCGLDSVLFEIYMPKVQLDARLARREVTMGLLTLATAHSKENSDWKNPPLAYLLPEDNVNAGDLVQQNSILIHEDSEDEEVTLKLPISDSMFCEPDVAPEVDESQNHHMERVKDLAVSIIRYTKKEEEFLSSVENYIQQKSWELNAQLQIWQQQAKVACRMSALDMTERVPPMILQKQFSSIVAPEQQFVSPPLPLIATDCSEHRLAWTNGVQSIWRPFIECDYQRCHVHDEEVENIVTGTNISRKGNLFVSSSTQRPVRVLLGDVFVSGVFQPLCSTVYYDSPLLLPPLSFRPVMLLHSESALPTFVYQMVAPTGYIALGLVVTKSDKPLSRLYRCVPSEWVVQDQNRDTGLLSPFSFMFKKNPLEGGPSEPHCERADKQIESNNVITRLAEENKMDVYTLKPPDKVHPMLVDAGDILFQQTEFPINTWKRAVAQFNEEISKKTSGKTVALPNFSLPYQDTSGSRQVPVRVPLASTHSMLATSTLQNTLIDVTGLAVKKQVLFTTTQPSLQLFTFVDGSKKYNPVRLGMGMHQSPQQWAGELFLNGFAALRVLSGLLETRQKSRLETVTEIDEKLKEMGMSSLSLSAFLADTKSGAIVSTPSTSLLGSILGICSPGVLKPDTTSAQDKAKIARNEASAGKFQHQRDLFGSGEGDEELEDYVNSDEVGDFMDLYMEQDEDAKRLKQQQDKFSSNEYEVYNRAEENTERFLELDMDGPSNALHAPIDREYSTNKSLNSWKGSNGSVLLFDDSEDDDEVSIKKRSRAGSLTNSPTLEELPAAKVEVVTEKKAKQVDMNVEVDTYEYLLANRFSLSLPCAVNMFKHYALWVGVMARTNEYFDASIPNSTNQEHVEAEQGYHMSGEVKERNDDWMPKEISDLSSNEEEEEDELSSKDGLSSDEEEEDEESMETYINRQKRTAKFDDLSEEEEFVETLRRQSLTNPIQLSEEFKPRNSIKLAQTPLLPPTVLSPSKVPLPSPPLDFQSPTKAKDAAFKFDGPLLCMDGLRIGDFSLNITPANFSRINLHEIVTVNTVHMPSEDASTINIFQATGVNLVGANKVFQRTIGFQIESTPPYTAPTDIMEHIKTLYWLEQIILNTQSSVRLSIIEDIDHALSSATVYSRNDGFQRVGAAVSLFSDWTKVLNVIPMMRRVDEDLCLPYVAQGRGHSNIAFIDYVRETISQKLSQRFEHTLKHCSKDWTLIRARSDKFLVQSRAIEGVSVTSSANEDINEESLAAEFASDLGLTVVESNVEKQEELIAAAELERSAAIRLIITKQSNLSQDLVAIQNNTKDPILFSMLMLTYYNLIHVHITENFPVPSLSVNERAVVAEWLDNFYILAGTLTEALPLDAASPVHRQFLFVFYQLKQTYFKSYMDQVGNNVTHLQENIANHEMKYLPTYNPTSRSRFGFYSTSGPVDVYELLQTFLTTMMTKFKIFQLSSFPKANAPCLQFFREAVTKLNTLSRIVTLITEAQMFYFNTILRDANKYHINNCKNKGGYMFPYQYTPQQFAKYAKAEDEMVDRNINLNELQQFRTLPLWRSDKAMYLHSICTKDLAINYIQRGDLEGNQANALHLLNSDLRHPSWVYQQLSYTKAFSSVRNAVKYANELYKIPETPMPVLYWIAQINNMLDYEKESTGLWDRIERVYESMVEKFTVVDNNTETAKLVNNSIAKRLETLETLIFESRINVENVIWDFHTLCQDVLVVQSLLVVEDAVSTLFTQRWWEDGINMKDRFIVPIRSFFKQCIGGLNVGLGELQIQRYFQKFSRNIAYVYTSSFVNQVLSANKPEWVQCIAAGKKENDYNACILADKIGADILDIQRLINEMSKLVKLPVSTTDIDTQTVVIRKMKFTRSQFGQDFAFCDLLLNFFANDVSDVLESLRKDTNWLSKYGDTDKYAYSCMVGITKPRKLNLMTIFEAASYLRGVPQDEINAHLTYLQTNFDELVAKHKAEPLHKINKALHIFMQCGRSLAAKNSNGIDSDPYVKVSLTQDSARATRNKGDLSRNTKVINSTLNPDWNQFLKPFAAEVVCEAENLEMICYDDNFITSNVLIGKAVISVNSIIQRCKQNHNNTPENVKKMIQQQLFDKTSPQSNNNLSMFTERVTLDNNGGVLHVTYVLADV